MKKIVCVCLLALAGFSLKANNIQVSDVGVTGQNLAGHFSLLGFNVTWENSWRTSNNESNWDAAWIFAKFRKKGSQTWQHATINYTAPGFAADCGHTAATGSIIKTAPDGKGAFIYRSADGIGSVNFTDNKLRWNYGVDGVLDTDSVEVNIYACEMVYVTPGAFYLGSNGTETAHFRRGDKDTVYRVSSEASISMGTLATNLYFTGGGLAGSNSGTIPAAYPKGFNAFYCMKYECSQQQYADFLNNIDAARAANRNPGTNQFTGVHPNLVPVAAERALGFAAYDDHAAYSDWAALRPMTELEYEKACRGYNIAPTPNEYAWGNTTLTHSSGVQNEGTANETITVGNCNYLAGGIGRLLRTGIFATAVSDRISSGGTYYGIMEMSGNAIERVISSSTTAGRLFAGEHGDGNLAANGESDIANFKTVDVYGFRGSGYAFNSSIYLPISDRYYAGYGETSRSAHYGIRCVRTAQ